MNPVWPSFDLLVANCGGLTEVLLFEVWDYDSNSTYVLLLLFFMFIKFNLFLFGFRDDFIGSCTMSLRHLLFWEKNPTWRLKNPKRMGIGKHAGYLEVVQLQSFVQGASAVATEHYRSQMASMQQYHQMGPPQGYPGGYGPPSGYYPSNMHANEFPSHIDASASFMPPQNQQHDQRNQGAALYPSSLSNEQSYYSNAVNSQQQNPQQSFYGNNTSQSPQQNYRNHESAYGNPPPSSGVNLEKKPQSTLNLEKKPQTTLNLEKPPVSNLPAYMTNY